MMMIICMLLATLCFALFAFLFLTADKNIVSAMICCCKETEQENVKNCQVELVFLAEQLQKNKDFKDKRVITQGKKLKKKMEEAQKRYQLLDKGKINVLDIIPIAGYRFMQLMGWDATNKYIKGLGNKCRQFKEKREAINYTYYLLGSLFGNMLLGVSVGLAILGLTLAMGMGSRGIVAGLVSFGIFAVIGYLPYDNVNAVIRNRTEEIENQFPQVVSKLALLTVAGMEVNQAWKLTADSGNGVLYREMRRVLTELDNNVLPREAYERFITRCNNKYTTKLATSIVQNISKGNAEIVTVFKTLNTESWLEHKHNARRKGEQIQSKLLVPTLLMFVGIIILIIIPVISGFNF